LGGAIIPGFSDAGFRAYAGGYYLQGDDTIGAGYGVKGRVEALVTQNFLVNVGYSNDTFYDSNLTVALTWYFGTGEDARWFQRIPQTNRLYQQMERNYRNMVLTHEVSDFVKALRAGGTGGSGGAVGTPITVVHVNNTAGAGGDGSWERPLNSLPGTTGSNVDIIYVDRGNGTTQNMTGGIVLNDWQRLLGEGVQHTFTSTPDGNTVRVRFIRPDSADLLPCVYYIHGGGMQTMSCYDGNYRAWGKMIAHGGVAVAMVEFRNAIFPSAVPDVGPYPAGLNDCILSATLCCLGHMTSYGNRLKKISTTPTESHVFFAFYPPLIHPFC
jgi:hypothetical protein